MHAGCVNVLGSGWRGRDRAGCAVLGSPCRRAHHPCESHRCVQEYVWGKHTLGGILLAHLCEVVEVQILAMDGLQSILVSQPTHLSHCKIASEE